MQIRVLFFGATAQEVGVRSKEIDLSDNAIATDLIDTVVAEHPILGRHKLLFSVDQEYVSGDVTLKDGDEVAIFTAVSGG